jgi:RimJ/RimL family protein N-acetyltransferase
MITFRQADLNDELLLFRWKNDPSALQQSFHSDPVALTDHQKWFRSKLEDPNHHFYVFEQNGEPAGLVRFDRKADGTVIGVVVDPEHRGQQLGAHMLQQATADYLAQFPDSILHAYIKKDNFASLRSFERAGFHVQETAAENQGILMIKTHVPG